MRSFVGSWFVGIKTSVLFMRYMRTKLQIVSVTCNKRGYNKALTKLFYRFFEFVKYIIPKNYI